MTEKKQLTAEENKVLKVEFYAWENNASKSILFYNDLYIWI